MLINLTAEVKYRQSQTREGNSKYYPRSAIDIYQIYMHMAM